MFFSAKYRKKGQQNNQRGRPDTFVLETAPGAQHNMAMAPVKFDVKSPAAAKLKAALFLKIKELW